MAKRQFDGAYIERAIAQVTAPIIEQSAIEASHVRAEARAAGAGGGSRAIMYEFREIGTGVTVALDATARRLLRYCKDLGETPAVAVSTFDAVGTRLIDDAARQFKRQSHNARAFSDGEAATIVDQGSATLARMRDRYEHLRSEIPLGRVDGELICPQPPGRTERFARWLREGPTVIIAGFVLSGLYGLFRLASDMWRLIAAWPR